MVPPTQNQIENDFQSRFHFSPAEVKRWAPRRIGVDQNSRPGLITHGLSRWTRNPIYLAMFVAFSGLLLMTPSWLTLPALLGSAIAVRSQVREEDAYLLRTYGDEFRRYAASAASFPAWGCSSIPSASTSAASSTSAPPSA